jgi:glycosyltransferase involved in cell wall biosynthesis
MNTRSTKYVVITPVRDEEVFLEATIESMVHRTILPLEWIIVDDGSKDNTGKIIDEFAQCEQMLEFSINLTKEYDYRIDAGRFIF